MLFFFFTLLVKLGKFSWFDHKLDVRRSWRINLSSLGDPSEFSYGVRPPSSSGSTPGREPSKGRRPGGS